MENETKPNKKNKLLIAGGIIAILLIGINIGNSSNKSESPSYSSSDSTDVVTPEKPTMSTDEIFITVLRNNNNSIIDSADDQTLIELGKQVCTTLDAGNSVTDIMYALVGSSDGSESSDYWDFAGMMIGAGVAAYCPEYTNQLG